MIASVGRHIEFCALTGNEARGLEILAEHAAWLTGTHLDAAKRLSFAAGACVLLRQLTELGYGTVAIGPAPSTVDSTLASLEQEIRELAGRYDARNGNTAVSDRVARRLAVVRHPQTDETWAKVASCGQDLPPEVAASVARASAGALLGPDPKAAYPALLAVAGQFAELGDLASAWEARATAALVQARVGDREEAAGTAALAIAEAEAAYAAGTLTPREYLAVRRARPLMAFDALAGRTDRPAADLASTAELIGAELATAERLGEQRYAATFQELLAQLSAWRGDQDEFQARIAAARTLYLAAGEPWHAARPAAILGQVALAGDPRAAEAFAREALANGAGLLRREETAQLSSLLAEAVSAQPDRTAELVGVFLAAASHWDGVSEPDMLHNTFNAARTYGRLGRPAEAAALFAEVMPRVDIPYEPAVIALTREQFGNALRELDRHREAVEQFLLAAALVQDDPAKMTAQARLAASAAESLQRVGQVAEALAAFQRAATLFAGLGDQVRRVRCLRSAAWLRFRESPAESGGPGAEPPGVTAMRAVLSDLESTTAADPDQDLVAELKVTRGQLEEMLADPDPYEEDE